MEKKLYRSAKNKVLGGVCGGLGEYFAIDPVIIRIFLVLAFFPFFPITVPFLPIVYIILWIVLPVDTAVKQIPENPENQSETKKTAPSFIFSLIIAFILIFIGFVILFPGYIFRFMDVLAFLIAFFLVFIAARLAFNMYKNKEASLFQASVGLICLSYGVFIVLNRLNLTGEGVFIEYSKNLAAGILIVLGVSLVFKNMKNKWPALITGSAIFLFIGVFSYLNGNYSPSRFMGRMAERVWPHFRNFDWKNWRSQIRSYSESVPLPSGAATINCAVNNTMGNLRIEGTDALVEFSGSGIPPALSTNFTKDVLALTFDNQASDTVFKLNRGKPVNLGLNVSAGSIEGSLEDMNIGELKINVSGGSVKIETGVKLKKMTIENSLGSTKVRLPENARIKIRTSSSMGDVKIPDGFKRQDGGYVYEGGGKNVIDITASAKLGSIEFEF